MDCWAELIARYYPILLRYFLITNLLKISLLSLSYLFKHKKVRTRVKLLIL